MRAEVFELAANIIEEQGLTKGRYCRKGRRCTLGAIMQAVGTFGGLTDEEIWNPPDHEGITWPTTQIVNWSMPYESYLSEQIRDRNPYGVPDWNDKKHRTKEQVVAALRQAAEKVRVEA